MSDKQKQTSLVTLFEKMKEHSKKQEENNENQSENATLQDSSDVVLEAMLCQAKDRVASTSILDKASQKDANFSQDNQSTQADRKSFMWKGICFYAGISSESEKRKKSFKEHTGCRKIKLIKGKIDKSQSTMQKYFPNLNLKTWKQVDHKKVSKAEQQLTLQTFLQKMKTRVL